MDGAPDLTLKEIPPLDSAKRQVRRPTHQRGRDRIIKIRKGYETVSAAQPAAEAARKQFILTGRPGFFNLNVSLVTRPRGRDPWPVGTA